MVNYLITGAVGFSGSRVSEMLVSPGNSVTGEDNLNPACDLHLKEYLLQKLQALPDFCFIKLDISAPGALAGHVWLEKADFDAVINLAAIHCLRPGAMPGYENVPLREMDHRG